jgi:alkylation response protein AidB-like acyl-CoA dehydrogenase
MRATFTDEQVALREVAADLAADARPDHPVAGQRLDESTTATRALMEGFAGLGLPEDANGAGGSLVDLVILLHELGRNVVNTRFVPHVLATQLAHGAGLDVSEAAAGQRTWALAVDETSAAPDGPWSEPGDDALRPRVAHAGDADAVVACVGTDDVAVLTGCTVQDEPDALDLGRPSGAVTLDGEVVARDPGAAAGLRRVWPLVGAELVGVGRGAVELAARYANDRQQFGQPIGRFQGVAHQLADALVAVENAWSLVLYAAWAVDAASEDADRAVSLAKASASEAAVFAAERATQVHGGIGITWEAMPHVHLRRAARGGTKLGDAGWHRGRVGRALVDAVA